MGNTQNSLIYNKALDFAVKSVTLYKYLTYTKKEFIISKQYLRSSTSIGANIRESLEAQSHKDFIAKLYIALKEAGETQYWLSLLMRSDFLDDMTSNSFLNDVKEIIKIINSIIKTTKAANNLL